MILGQRIREERERRNWTQNDLAELLNVSRQSISKWEIGSAYPDIERLIQISDLFEVSLDSLIRGDEKFQKKIKVESSKDIGFFSKLKYLHVKIKKIKLIKYN